MNQTTTFGAIVADWERPLLCEMPTQAGPQCRRAAAWRINLHGCEQANACGQHMNAWKRSVLFTFGTAWPRCAHCGRSFYGLSDAFTVSAL